MKAHSNVSTSGEMTEVIDTAAGTGGLVHVCVFLAKAFEQATPALGSRADIHKCAGAGITGCATCTRMLAPTGDGQRWAKPQIDGDGCANFANIERFAGLYAATLAQGV